MEFLRVLKKLYFRIKKVTKKKILFYEPLKMRNSKIEVIMTLNIESERLFLPQKTSKGPLIRE